MGSATKDDNVAMSQAEGDVSESILIRHTHVVLKIPSREP